MVDNNQRNSADLTHPAVLTDQAVIKKPVETLERLFISNQTKIEAWFEQQWQQTPAPISSSIDLRNAGFKLAPIDTNLFPAGFNNLNEMFLPQSISAAKNIVAGMFEKCKNILLIAESHTRNQYYFASLAALETILTAAGFAVRIGTLAHTAVPQQIVVNEQRTITLEPLQRKGDKIVVHDFVPCLIFLNNDLSEGNPDILKNLTQPVKPSPQLGWHSRLKTRHFTLYDQVCQEFSRLIGCDPWLLNPMFTHCDNVNFMSKQGMEELAEKTAILLDRINVKYQEYNIPHPPFIAIKANAGTYGMAVFMVKSPHELLNLNRDQRKQMSYVKGKKVVNQVIIQEGVYTFETWGSDHAVAEPVIYMLTQHLIGGFYRVHTRRGKDENLNAPGMRFESIPFAESCLTAYHTHDHAKLGHANCFYAYGVVARLALLAAARELAELPA